MFEKMEYVYQVYREKSFTKAAAKLYVSQPCLSAAIKKIEEQIGMPLFERRYSDLRPTKIGYEYLDCAQKMMELEKDFLAKVNGLNSLECGRIRVGGPNYISSYILPHIVSEFSRMYPKIEIDLVETNSVELEKLIHSEEIDLVIDSYDDVRVRYDSFPLTCEKILLAVPMANACNKELVKYGITPEELYDSSVDVNGLPEISVNCFKDESFILLKRGNSMYQHAMTVFDSADFVPKVSFYLDQLSTSYSLMTSGNGVCFVTDAMFRYHKYTDEVILYNVKGGGSRVLYASKKRARYTSAIVSEFIEVSKRMV